MPRPRPSGVVFHGGKARRADTPLMHPLAPVLAGGLPPLIAEATLPPSARTALVAGMAGGAVLLLFGARLLRPAVVLAAILAGFLGALVTARALLPDMPLWIAAAAGAAAGLVAGALLYRPAVALAAATVGASVGGLVAFAVMAGGSLDTAPRDLGHAWVESPRLSARDGEGARAGMRLVELMAPARDAEAPDAPGTGLPVGERVLRSSVEVARRTAGRVEAAYLDTAPAYRTLLSGSVLAGAIVGLLAGLMATTTVARILTSCVGAWILLVSALPLLALRGAEPMPDDARAWLVSVAALAVAGTVAQGALAPGRRGTGRPAASPAATAARTAAAATH